VRRGPFDHQPLTALEQWKASRHRLLWVAVINRNVGKRDAPDWMLCRATITNQALVDRKERLSASRSTRVSTPNTVISGPFYMSMVLTQNDPICFFCLSICG